MMRPRGHTEMRIDTGQTDMQTHQNHADSESHSSPRADGDLSAELGLLPSSLRLAVMRLSRRLRQQASGQVTASQLSALTTVRYRGPLSLGEMATIEQIAPPSMTRIAARLEESGLVERQVDPSDRRVARLALTPAGEQLLDEYRTRRDQYLAGLLLKFSSEELRTLEEALPLLERLATEE